MALCQNKANTKIILHHYGVTSAPFVTIPRHLSRIDSELPLDFPLLVKPVTEGSSKGIEEYNKVNSYVELELAVQKLRAKFLGEDILVEPFLAGREFTVSILGTGPGSRVIGITEHLFRAASKDSKDEGLTREEFAGWKSKLSEGHLLRAHYAPDSEDHQIKAACQLALNAWTTLNCRDAGRVDIRFDSDDADGVPNVLEVNPVAGLLPGHSPLPASAEQNGLNFEMLLTAIIQSALQRKCLEKTTSVLNVIDPEVGQTRKSDKILAFLFQN